MALGTVVCLDRSVIWAVIYIAVSVIGQMWFMSTICTRCAGYGSAWCSSGYGKMTARMFGSRPRDEFQSSFNRNIWVVFPQFFIPLVAGGLELYDEMEVIPLALLVLFVAVAFVWIPYKSRVKGCAHCPQRKNCAWGGGRR